MLLSFKGRPASAGRAVGEQAGPIRLEGKQQRVVGCVCEGPAVVVVWQRVKGVEARRKIVVTLGSADIM